MAKSVSASTLDAALSHIRNNASAVHACSAAPTDRASALSLSLGNVAVTSAAFTLGAGTPNGRRVTLAAQTLTGTAAGTANHLAIISGTELLYVTECTSVGMTNGGTQQFSAVTYDINNPT
jgi:hypothetical protein